MARAGSCRRAGSTRVPERASARGPEQASVLPPSLEQLALEQLALEQLALEQLALEQPPPLVQLWVPSAWPSSWPTSSRLRASSCAPARLFSPSCLSWSSTLPFSL